MGVCIEKNHCDGVVMVPAVTVDNECILVEQYRPALSSRTIEWTAGLVGDDGNTSDLLWTCMRELEEETGYKPYSIDHFGSFCTSAGLTDETIDIILAGKCKKVSQGGGVEGENIKVHIVSDIDNFLLEMMKNPNIILDSKLYTGVYLLRKYGFLK